MPSSSRPYQSKVLRFVLKQWQQGWERQDRAWRQVQSTATWGAQVAIFPLYAIMRAVERASFAIDSSSEKSVNSAQGKVTDIEHSLTAIFSHTQQLLSTKQKGQLSITPELTGQFAPKNRRIHHRPSAWGNVVKQMRRLLPGKPKTNYYTTITNRKPGPIQTTQTLQRTGELAPGQQTGINHSSSSILIQPRNTLASSLKTRKLVLVDSKNQIFDILTPSQRTDLTNYIAQVMLAYERTRSASNAIAAGRSQKQLPLKPTLALNGNRASNEPLLHGILSHTQKLLSPKQQKQLAIAPRNNLIRQTQNLFSRAIAKISHLGSLTPTQNNSIQHNNSSKLAQQGLTLASSLKTQGIVLVNLKNEVFDIFTPAQQSSLQQYIARVIWTFERENPQPNPLILRQSQPLSLKKLLVIGGVFFTALPLELENAWAQLSSGPQTPQLPQIKTNGIQAEPKSRILYPRSSNTVSTRAHQLQQEYEQIQHRYRLTSNSTDAFEANVNDVSYLEHPLERVLRWLDRILTWCERRWQKLRKAKMG